jgi:hypothetical protein
MNSFAVALAVRDLLAAAVWPGLGGEVVFGKVLVSAGVDVEQTRSQLRFPFVRILPDSLDVDDEAEDLVTQRFVLSVVQSVAGDPWGETVLLGGPGPAGGLTSKGRGLMALEQVVFDAVRLLSAQDGIQVQFTGASAVSAQLDAELGYVAQRDYTFEAWTGAGSAP